MRGGARVCVLRSPGALGEPRREALVVQLHRDFQSPFQPLGKRARGPRLLPLLTAQGQRQAHHDPLRALLLDEPREGAEALPGVRPLDRGQRGGERARGVRDRAAATSRPVVEGEDPRHQPASAFSISARAVASASGSFSGSRPPACAIVSRPPPPPPATWAAARTTSPAFTPRSAATPGATFATRCTRPSTAVPRTTAASPRRWRTASESSRRAFASGALTASTTTLTPLTSSAPPTSSSAVPRSGPPAGFRCSSLTRSPSRSTARPPSCSGTFRRAAISRSRSVRLRNSSAL